MKYRATTRSGLRRAEHCHVMFVQTCDYFGKPDDRVDPFVWCRAVRGTASHGDVDPTEALVLDNHARKVERLEHDAVVEVVIDQEAFGTRR